MTVFAASSELNGLVGVNTNMMPFGSGTLNEPVIWSAGWPIADAKSRSADVPSAASLLEL